MKRIVILTATRAEYGLLRPLMMRLLADKYFDVRIAVTGAHLSQEFGMTVQEIEKDGLPIDKKIEIVLSSDTAVSVSKSMGLAMISFSEYFSECNPDALLVLGDRYETLAVCACAMNARIPIIHLHGGEATEGLIDEAIRHSITKMSFLHFVSTEVYRKRVIQLGEAPNRVFNVGALGVENAIKTDLMSLRDLEDSLGFKLGQQFAVGTFHPVTLENMSAECQIRQLLDAIKNHKDLVYIFTKANADTDGRIINRLLADYDAEHEKFHLVDSLGMRKYFSALKYAKFVIGNSSSGLIEAPSFAIPTIDIGDRQKGRITCESVIHCEPTAEQIDRAISIALDDSFRNRISAVVNPYGDGKTSEKIVKIVKDFFENEKIDIKKKFYDVTFEE